MVHIIKDTEEMVTFYKGVFSMSIRMGIIGAENSHAAAIAKIININKKIRGVSVTHLWGETGRFAKATAEAGAIPNIVKKPSEMLGSIDCVMIDHRDGKHHLRAAAPFVKAGIPCFIDKPFSNSTEEVKRFLKLRREHNVPVTSFSAVPHYTCIKNIKKRMHALAPLRYVHLCGPGDRKSKYGGIFFYGIHLADLMVELLGTNIKSVQAAYNGNSCNILCNYPESLAAGVSIMPDVNGWSVMAMGARGSELLPVTMDAPGHLAGVKKFINMFRTGKEPYSDTRLLAPVAMLEAACNSCREKRPVRPRF